MDSFPLTILRGAISFAEPPVDYRGCYRAWLEPKPFHHIASTPSSVFAYLCNRLAASPFFTPIVRCILAAFLSGSCLPQMASCLSIPSTKFYLHLAKSCCNRVFGCTFKGYPFLYRPIAPSLLPRKGSNNLLAGVLCSIYCVIITWVFVHRSFNVTRP